MIEKNVSKIVCGAGACKNTAEYSLRTKGFVRGGKFYLCTECLKVLYAAAGKIFTPKSPTHTLRKIKEKGQGSVRV